MHGTMIVLYICTMNPYWFFLDVNFSPQSSQINTTCTTNDKKNSFQKNFSKKVLFTKLIQGVESVEVQ